MLKGSTRWLVCVHGGTQDRCVRYLRVFFLQGSTSQRLPGVIWDRLCYGLIVMERQYRVWDRKLRIWVKMVHIMQICEKNEIMASLVKCPFQFKKHKNIILNFNVLQTPIDECSIRTDSCPVKSTCHQMEPGYYVCVCDPGYVSQSCIQEECLNQDCGNTIRKGKTDLLKESPSYM